MNNSKQKFGICDKSGKDWINYINSIEEDVFSHVELYVQDVDKKESPIFNNTLLKEIRAIAKEKNLTLSLHCLMGINLGEKVKRLRQASIDIVKDTLCAADQMDALWTTIHLGTAGVINGDIKKFDRLQFVADSINEITNEHFCSKVGLENAFAVPNNTRPTRLGDSPEEFDYLFSKIEHEKAVGIILDFGHARIIANNFNKYWEKLQSHILACHMHWNNGVLDQHKPLLEENLVALKQYEKSLKEMSEKNIPFLFECKSVNDNLLSIDALKKFL